MNILQKLYPQNDEKMIEVKLDKEHFPFKLLAHKTTVEDFIQGKIINPIHCRIGLTNKCNLRCKFCNFHSENEKDFYDEFSFEDFMDKDRMISFLDDFSKNGGKAITLCGSGEPTIHPDYVEICEYANKVGIQIGLITNGSMLTNEKILNCIKKTHTWVRVGLNAGSQETYSRITSTTIYKFSAILEAVSKLKNESAESEFRIGLNFVITMDNYEEIFVAAEEAKKYGADYIRFEPEFYSALAHKTIYDHLEQIELELEKAKKLSDAQFEVSIPKLNRGAMTKTDQIEGDFDVCYYSEFVTALGANGCMYPCPQIHLNKDYNMGNIEEGYEKWLKGASRDNWKKNHEDRKKMCKTCFYRPQNEMLNYLKNGKVKYDEVIKLTQEEYGDIIHRNFV